LTISLTLNLDPQHIEAIIFASEGGIAFEDLKQVLANSFQIMPSDQELELILVAIKSKYEDNSHIFSLHAFDNHYQFLTKATFHVTLQHLEAFKDSRKLSQAALETLAIIAYRQPVTKLEVEEIRGVNCDYSVQKLLKKNLIEIRGKADTVGKPILYGTSTAFVNYFGLDSIHDLPQLKDLSVSENSIGDQNE